MTIMFPLITGPTYLASNGNLNIFYGTIASILSGAILGDHSKSFHIFLSYLSNYCLCNAVSPISDTTVLSSLASRCTLMAHVTTQAPYALVPGMFAIIWGTLPVAYGGKSLLFMLVQIVFNQYLTMMSLIAFHF